MEVVHREPYTMMKDGRPHLVLSFTLKGKIRSHPVRLVLSPEAAETHDHDAFISRWKAHYSAIEDADEGYRAMQGKTLQICHHEITVTDCKLLAESPRFVRLIVAYSGKWNGIDHSGNKYWEGVDLSKIPSPEAAMKKLDADFRAECERTHRFQRIMDGIPKS